LFVSVAVFAALDVPTASFPKDELAGVAVASKTPVPVSDTVCGLLLTLFVTLSVPVRGAVPRNLTAVPAL
jgi:hypothetical protein